ncbi:hypothetical protein [Floridanema evergladense]|uniref:Uncharacterized protein n=1 Tax=Floridaenema evergladense BLCC-F167 TaxID=3153639 RepID=A0ABV4WRW3_9CYAN
MRQLSLIALFGTLAILMGGCGGGENQTATSPSPTTPTATTPTTGTTPAATTPTTGATPTATTPTTGATPQQTPTQPFSSPMVDAKQKPKPTPGATATKPAPNIIVNAPPQLIQPTDPKQRVAQVEQQIAKANRDPFGLPPVNLNSPENQNPNRVPTQTQAQNRSIPTVAGVPLAQAPVVSIPGTTTAPTARNVPTVGGVPPAQAPVVGIPGTTKAPTARNVPTVGGVPPAQAPVVGIPRVVTAPASQTTRRTAPQAPRTIPVVSRGSTGQRVATQSPRLNRDAQALIDQFFAVGSRLEVNMKYDDYVRQVTELKVLLDRYGRKPEANNDPVFRKLRSAFQEYDSARRVWNFLITSREEFLPVSSELGSLLVRQYGVRTFEAGGNRYISLEDVLQANWNRARNYVQAAANGREYTPRIATVVASRPRTPQRAQANRTVARTRQTTQRPAARVAQTPQRTQQPRAVAGVPQRTQQPRAVARAPQGNQTPNRTVATAPNPAVVAPPAPPEIPTLPPPPDPTLAKAVLVSGVVVVGTEPQAIVRAPDEASSRYVRAGQRLANGQVLVKRIEFNEGSEPVVVLEQNGVEVAKAVGERPAAPAQAQPGRQAVFPTPVTAKRQTNV